MLHFSHLGRRSNPPTIAKLMAMALENPNLLSLAAGFTDNTTLPLDAIRRATAGLTEKSALQYGTNQGHPRLRQLIADRIARQDQLPARQAAALPAQTLITNGSQQALYLAMQVLCDPGDIVLTDRPTYFVYLEMLAGLGITPISIPVTPDNTIDTPALDQLLTKLRATNQLPRLKALYLVSYYSNPSGRSLSTDEKTQLAATLARHQLHELPVLEDAAYRELHFAAPHPAKSLLAHPDWQTHPILYLGTLTKPYATGLKIGYAITPHDELRHRMLHVKGHHDFGTANYNQTLLAHLLETKDLDRQLEILRPAYRQKMLTLDAALRDGNLSQHGWHWTQPEGGLYLWLRAPQKLDTGLNSDFCRACIEAGVLYVPGELCYGDNPPPNYIRASYGVLNENDLRQAAARLCQVAKKFS